MRIARIGALVALSLIGTGCGDAGDGSGFGDDDGAGAATDAGANLGCFSSNECPVGFFCNEFGQCEAPPVGDDDAGMPPPPPEVEREFGEPTSSLRYLYVAMPELDALAKIDGSTLEVVSVPVGDRPELVAVIPGRDDALVFQAGTATATLVRPTVDHDEKLTLATLPHLNDVEVDATGKFAVAWFDLTKAITDAGGLANVGEVGSFQDVTVFSFALGEELAVDLAVGFRPREVEYDAAGTRAFVITDDGVSVIDLELAAAGMVHVAATIPVAADPLSDPGMIEVDITADGAWAIVRERGRAELRLVRMDDSGEAHTIPLPSEATDIDLGADGLRAYAVLRDVSMLAIVDVPGDGLDPAGLELVQIGSEVVGSAIIDQDHGRALLFTNAFDVEKIIVVDIVSPAHPWVVRPLKKGIRTVALAPDGRTALVLHSKQPGDPLATGNVEDFVDRSFGYSLLDLPTGFAKLAITPVDPGAFAFTPDGAFAYLGLDGGDAEGAVTRLQIIDLTTYVVDDLQLGSPPEAVGVLPSVNVAFVSQRHALGRVTFVDVENKTTRTVTGFELASQIVD